MILDDKRKVVLILRWALIVVTSYLILSGKPFRVRFDGAQLLILAYVVSHIILTFLPRAWFFDQSLFYALGILDTVIVSLGMVLSQKVTSDFYLVFFLIVILASVNGNLRLPASVSGIACVTYGVLLYSSGLFRSDPGIEYTLRIPLMLVVCASCGYVASSFAKEKRQRGGLSEDQLVLRDLTEQRSLQKKIQEAKRSLEAIFDGIRDQLSAQSPDFTILRVNRAVAEKYHSPFLELIGRKCYETYYHRAEPCEACPVAQTLHTKQFASSVMKHLEEERTFRVCSYPILDEKGDVFSVIEHVQDITDEHRLQEQLVQSEKLAGIGYLASGVAHEINNPLSGIIGMAEAAREEEDVPTIRGYLGDILNCSHRISEIVKGLRAYSRAAKQGDQSLIDLNEVLENSLKMVRMGLKAGGVDVLTTFQPVEKVEANPGEIQQVFVNLITNAFQAVNGKGGRVTLATRSLKDFVEVKVGDNGIGIPQKYLSKVFDPFFTTKPTGEGTGLGLNVVYRIVTKYGGAIDVDSREGLGAIFTVRFPIRREEG
jgi:C4-dicarboxylate-specific signal transduction histidine kinase